MTGHRTYLDGRVSMREGYRAPSRMVGHRQFMLVLKTPKESE